MAIGNLTDNMMTVAEVSRILHVHPNTLRRWSDKGLIKSYCITLVAIEGLCPGISISF